MLLFVLLVPLNAIGQQIHFERLAEKEGLYKRTITCGLQDKTGFMWFGSEDGLLRYGGYAFEEFVYNPDDLNSLSSNMVYALLEDQQGMIWIGTVGGLYGRLEQILLAGLRARDLVQQILTFSRKEKREQQPVKVAPLIGEVLSLLRSTIVISFTDTKQALISFMAKSDIIDLLITDMAMPELTGVEVAERMKARRQDIPVILCTGYSSKIFTSEPHELGMDAILVKPVKRLDLLDVVYSLLTRNVNSIN